MTNLTSEQIEKIKKYKFYKRNPISFMEDLCYVPTVGGDQLVRLRDCQKDVINKFYQGDNRLVILKSRQTGFSTTMQLIIVHLVTFFSNVVCGIASRDGSEASDFCRKVTNCLDKLPQWIHPGYNHCSVQSFSTKRGSQLWSSAISPSNPEALFRGKSISLLILDEAAHARNVDKAWTGVAMSLSFAQKVAKDKKIPFGTIILSTPNKKVGIGQFFYEMYISAVNKTNGFSPVRVHWSEVPEFKNDPNWYNQQCEILNWKKAKIRQELELEFIDSEESLFDAEVQSALQKPRGKNFQSIKMREGGDLKLFKNFDSKKFQIIGVDTASAFGTDYSAIIGMDYVSMEQTLEYRGKLEPKLFSKVLKSILKLVPKNIIVIENTGGYGLTVLNELQFDENHSYNIFGEISENQTQSKRRIFKPGLGTTAKTRPLILDALFEYVESNPDIIKSESLALELLNLSSKSNKIEASSGGNDDLCMAFGFCCYLRKYKKEVLVSEIDSEMEYDNYSDGEMEEFFGNLNEIPMTHMFDKMDLREYQKKVDKYIKENFHKIGPYVKTI